MSSLHRQLLKELNELEKQYKRPVYIQTDPIRYVYLYRHPLEIEIIGFLTALFSYGNVKAIFKFLDAFLSFLSGDPVNRILSFQESRHIPFVYRFQNSRDIKIILLVLKEMLKENTATRIFAKPPAEDYSDIYHFINTKIDEIKNRIPGKYQSAGIKHFFALSGQDSPKKRYCLFFRWMVRKDFPDFGIYTFIPQNKLIYPVDIHIANFCYERKIITSRNITARTAIRITDFFKTVDPEDPLRFDFYITRAAISKKIFS